MPRSNPASANGSGRAAGDFDIALIVRKILEPHEFAARNREESGAWKKLFARLGVESLVYGFVAIQRRTGARQTFTVRRQASPGSRRAPWEWLLAWESAATEDLTRLILERPLHRGCDAEFQVRHRLEGSAWTPQRYTLRTEWPFSMECDAHPWMANLISLCDGRATGRDQLRVLVENEVLPRGIRGRGVRPRGGRPGFRRVHRSGRVQAASGRRMINSNCGDGKSPGT